MLINIFLKTAKQEVLVTSQLSSYTRSEIQSIYSSYELQDGFEHLR